jgi:hypothetical protein
VSEPPAPEPPAAPAAPVPPAAEQPLRLPRTWRPRKARAFGLAIAISVVVIVGFVAMLLPSAGGTGLRPGDRIGVFSVGLGIAWFLLRHASVRLIATEGGLEVVNLFRRRHLEWTDITGVTLRKGDPWVTLQLRDDTSVSVMGIQSSDGEDALVSARELARLVARESARVARAAANSPHPRPAQEPERPSPIDPTRT